MNFEKCKICRQTFHSYGSRVCPACQEQLDKDFFAVRDYLEEHPRDTIDKIVEGTGVEERHIMYLLEDNRLTMAGLSPSGLGKDLGEMKCQICGRPISSGKLCPSCQSSIKELGSALADSDRKASPSTYVTPRSNK